MRRVPALVLTCLLALTACSDVDPEAADSTPTGNPLTITGTDALAWNPQIATVDPGEVELTIECGLSIDHAFAIEGVQGGETLVACEATQVAMGSVDLEPGVYTYVCNVPGHLEEGMEGELNVRG